MSNPPPTRAPPALNCKLIFQNIRIGLECYETKEYAKIFCDVFARVSIKKNFSLRTKVFFLSKSSISGFSLKKTYILSLCPLCWRTRPLRMTFLLHAPLDKLRGAKNRGDKVSNHFIESFPFLEV